MASVVRTICEDGELDVRLVNQWRMRERRRNRGFSEGFRHHVLRGNDHRSKLDPKHASKETKLN